MRKSTCTVLYVRNEFLILFLGCLPAYQYGAIAIILPIMMLSVGRGYCETPYLIQITYQTSLNLSFERGLIINHIKTICVAPLLHTSSSGNTDAYA